MCFLELGWGSLFPLASAAEVKGQTWWFSTHPELTALTTVTFPWGQEQPQQWEQGRNHDRGLGRQIGRDNLSGNSWVVGAITPTFAPSFCAHWRQGVAMLELRPGEGNSWKSSLMAVQLLRGIEWRRALLLYLRGNFRCQGIKPFVDHLTPCVFFHD